VEMYERVAHRHGWKSSARQRGETVDIGYRSRSRVEVMRTQVQPVSLQTR
jgi:hypothetical protein